MVARFILSLDCEGKWGVADQLTPKLHRDLSDANMRVGYEQILALLDEFSISATFAFVGLFAEEPERIRRLRPELRALARHSPRYLGPALDDLEHGSRQGWHGAWAIDRVVNAKTRHELALHGVTHVPWDMMSQDQARDEMMLLEQFAGPVRLANTFVYPRNRVAHTTLLKDFGIVGFRQSPVKRTRLGALLAEFNVFAQPDKDGPPGNPQPIPAGLFVNWQSSIRRAVPIILSEARAARMLTIAADRKEIVHFWLHPENVVSAPRTLTLLRKIIELVARYRDAGRCDVLTQLDYCRSAGDYNDLAEPRHRLAV